MSNVYIQEMNELETNLDAYDDPNANVSICNIDDVEVEVEEKGKTTKNGWQLDPKDCKKTIYNKKKCLEYPNIYQVYGFITTEMGICTINLQPEWCYKSELEHMRKYRQNWNGEAIQVQHILPKHKWGRINAVGSLSLSHMVRGTRHALALEEYVDIDMSNSHPVIFSQFCKLNGHKCPYLDAYCANRDAQRKMIMKHHDCDKDTAKRLCLSLLFGGMYISWIKEPKNNITKNDKQLLQFFVDLEVEIRGIANIVYVANHNSQLKNILIIYT